MNDLPTFSEMMDTLFALKKQYPEMQWSTRWGTLQMTVYVGMENQDMLEQAGQMFEPLD